MKKILEGKQRSIIMTYNGIFKLSLYITLANYPNIDSTLMLGQLFKLFALSWKGHDAMCCLRFLELK